MAAAGSFAVNRHRLPLSDPRYRLNPACTTQLKYSGVQNREHTAKRVMRRNTLR